MSVKVCPLCGSTDLKAKVIVEALQNPEGRWEYQIHDEDLLNEAMDDPSVEVRCGSKTCGPCMDGNGQPVPLDAGLTLLQNWLVMNKMSPDVEYILLSPELRKEYDEWEAGLSFTPWEGTIGDCQDLQ